MNKKRKIHDKPTTRGKKVKKDLTKKTVTSKPVEKKEDSKANKIIDMIFNRFGLLLVLITITGLLAYIFRDFISQKYIYLFKDIGSDTLNIFYPNMIGHGENTSRWSFYEGMGRAMGGISNEFQNMTYTPWNWLHRPLYFIGAKLGLSQLPYNIVFGQIKNFILIGFFFYLYLRTIGIKGYSAYIGTLMFTFSGYMVLGSSWQHTNYAILIVLVLFSFEQLYKKNNWLFLPYAFFILNSYFYYLYGLFLIFYSLFRFIDENGFKIKELAILWIKVGLLGLVGIGLSASSTVSAIYNVLNTPRGGGGSASYVEPLSSFPIFGFEKSIHYISAIMRTFASDLLGNGNSFRGWRNYLEDPVFYCGLIGLLLVPQVFIHLNKRRRYVFAAFLSMWIIVIIFPFFRYAYYKFVGDYYKQAIDLIVPITLIFFSMYALNFIVAQKKKVNLYLLGGTLVFLLIALYYPYFKNSRNYVESHLQANVRNFLMLYTIFIGALNYRKFVLPAKMLILVLLVIELGYLSFHTVNKRQAVAAVEMDSRTRTGYNDYTKEAIQHIKKHDPNFYRLEKDYSSGTAMHRSLNDAKVQNYYGTANYSSFNQANYIKFLQTAKVIDSKNETATRWAPGFRTRPLLMNMASVKYILSKQEKPEFQKFGYYPIYDSLGVKILENKFFIPLGYTYDNYITLSEFEKLPNTTLMDISILKSCILDEKAEYYSQIIKGLKPLPFDSLKVNYTWQRLGNDILNRKTDTLNITSFQHHHIKGTINCKKSEMLYFSIPYDPGWNAKVDGKEAEVYQVNVGFCGIMLSAGKHDVEIEYILPGTDIARTITGIFFFIYIGLILYFIYDRRKWFISVYEKTLNFYSNKVAKT